MISEPELNTIKPEDFLPCLETQEPDSALVKFVKAATQHFIAKNENEAKNLLLQGKVQRNYIMLLLVLL